MESATVKKYSCMYTKDKHKKAKVWHDGELRHHHYNSKLFILSTEMAEVDSTFYRPAPFVTRRIQVSPGDSKALPSSFVLKEGEEVEFDGGWMAEVGEVVFERETNLTEMFKQSREARSQASEGAKEWARVMDDRNPRPSTSTSTTPRPAASSSSSISQQSNKPSGSVSKGYKGFGIAPPQSYLDRQAGKTPSTSSSNKNKQEPSSSSKLKGPSASLNTPNSRSKPYDRPTPGPASDNLKNLLLTATPAIKASFAVTNSAATSSPFRPPSFTRPTPPSGVIAEKSKSITTDSAAMERRRLLQEQNRRAKPSEG
ncbi:hypothetical protein T439DRAFT_327325 [Meredithblackwellia eburnea MCA 4105]